MDLCGHIQGNRTCNAGAGSIPETGCSFPVGATVVRGGANFSVFSRSADSIELLLFDRVEDARPSRVISMDPIGEPHLPLLARIRSRAASRPDLRLPRLRAV